MNVAIENVISFTETCSNLCFRKITLEEYEFILEDCCKKFRQEMVKRGVGSAE